MKKYLFHSPWVLKTINIYNMYSNSRKHSMDLSKPLDKEENIILVQVYVDDIIFGSTNEELCETFVKIMKSEFEMSMMGELNYFLGL